MDLLIIFILAAIVIWTLEYHDNSSTTSLPPRSTIKRRSVLAPSQHSYLDSLQLKEFRSRKSSYLRSSRWQDLRELVIARDGGCTSCGCTSNLNVHHRRYTNLEQEPLSDLVTLCSSCHTTRHELIGYPQTLQEYMDFNDLIP